MKTIENKITGIDLIEEGGSTRKVEYKDLIEAAMKQPPQGGFSFDDLDKRFRIREQIEKSKKKELQFEDADFGNVKRIVLSARWQDNEEVYQFLKLIKEMN